MPFVPVEDTMRCVLTFTNSAGDTAVNVIHVRTDDAPVTSTVVDNLIILLSGWLSAEWANVSSSEWRATRIEVRDLTSEFSYYVSETVNIPGLSVSSGLPPQDTVAISLRSPVSGRSRRGRLFHVGLAEDSQEGGYLNPTAITNLVAAYEALRADIVAAGMLWVVVSYVEDGAPRAEPLRTNITNIIITDNIIDSMDKRKPTR